MSAQITAWLFDSLVLFMRISLILVWLYSVFLVLLPDVTLRLQQRINRRFSTRQLSRYLEMPINLDRYLYRHARPVGVCLLLGSVGLLYLNWQLPATIQAGSPALWAWLAESLFWFLWIAGTTIFLIGLTCFVRPSLLKPLERRANQWVSSRQKTQFLNHEYRPLDTLLQQNPRSLGIVLAAISSLLLIMLIRV